MGVETNIPALFLCFHGNLIKFFMILKAINCWLEHFMCLLLDLPIPVASRSKVCVCVRWLAGLVGSNTVGDVDVCLLCVCCQVEVSATGRSLIRRSPTECGVCECN